MSSIPLDTVQALDGQTDRRADRINITLQMHYMLTRYNDENASTYPSFQVLFIL